MEKKVTNFELFKYYLMQEDGETEVAQYYEQARKNCEKCGKSIQAGERVFNAIRSNRKSIAKQIFDNYELWDEDNVNLGAEYNLDINEKKKLINILKDDEYSQKWHLLIAFYWYSELNMINNFPDKYVTEIEWNKNIEDTPWCLKGNIKSTIKDPLLIIWMLEAASIMVPKSIKDCVNIEENCIYANKETDKKVLNLLFKRNDAGKVLGNIYWAKLMEKIKKTRIVSE